MPKRSYSALELAGDWWWDEEYYAATTHGRALWDAVGMQSGSRMVRLARLDNKKERAFIRYVKPETRMRLIAKHEKAT